VTHIRTAGLTALARDDAAPLDSRLWPRLILSGHARLPQDAAARALYEILAIVASVDPATGVILDVDSSLITRTARDYVADLLIGTSLDEPATDVLATVQRMYWGGAKKALAAAVRELYDSWAEVKGTL
jgi:hypothetical protein